MTKKEWLIHMLNGGKGTSDRTKDTEHIFFNGEKFQYNTGAIVSIDSHIANFSIYEEAKFKLNEYVLVGVDGDKPNILKQFSHMDYNEHPYTYIMTDETKWTVCEEPQFTYPMWFKSTVSGLIVKFTGMNNGEIVSDSKGWKVGDVSCILMPHTNTAVWTQIPKPMVKVAKYRFFNSVRYVDTQAFYVDDIDFKKDYTYDEVSNLTRLLETEIEVEDY